MSVHNLSKSFEMGKSVLSDLSFELEKGELLFVLGNSGGGKSTLLNLLTGIEKPDSGEIHKDGTVLFNSSSDVSIQERSFGLIFQDYALFPHLSVDANIRFGFKGQESEIEELYNLIRLSKLKKRFPHELSGGEQQRVALARALAAKPDVLLMDEPFSSIDVVNRRNVRIELKEILNKLGLTAIVVTHDFRDALEMNADKVMVLDQGKMIQFGSLSEIQSNPSSDLVKALVSS